MNTSVPPPVRNDSGSPAGDTVVCWRLVALAAPEDTLLLARALQKFAVPEIELRSVGFETGGYGHPARLELTFLACKARAQLATVRLRKLIAVHKVTLRPADKPTKSV